MKALKIDSIRLRTAVSALCKVHQKSILFVSLILTHTTGIVARHSVPSNSGAESLVSASIMLDSPSPLLANETQTQKNARKILAEDKLKKALLAQELSKCDAEDAIMHVITLLDVHKSVCERYWSDDAKFMEALAELIQSGKFDNVGEAFDRIILRSINLLQSKIEKEADCITEQATLNILKKGMRSPEASVERTRAVEIYNALMNAADGKTELHLPSLYLYRYVSLMNLLYYFPMFMRQFPMFTSQFP